MLLKIGELAKRAGLTVRTLHHYDAIGLLCPSVRADNGFRQYHQDDVIRLHRIQALKKLGYSLPVIKTHLDDSSISPLEMIEQQIVILDEQVKDMHALRERLQWVQYKLTVGGKTAVDDWLTLLEMMAMYEKHLSPDELADFKLHNHNESIELKAQWAKLVEEVQREMDHQLAPSSEYAQELGWRWNDLVKRITNNNPSLAKKLQSMQESEWRAQEINGINPALIEWIVTAIIYARTQLLAKYLTDDELAEVRYRQLKHIHDWSPLITEIREQMKLETPIDDSIVQALAKRWQALFLASYCGDNQQLEHKIRTAFPQEPKLMSGIGIDVSLIVYVQKALMHSLPSAQPSVNQGPKPSAKMVAVSRALHQLLDQPIVFDDFLALKILGQEEEDNLRKHALNYNDPMSQGLRTALAVRIRLAEDELYQAQQNGVKQYVVLGAGLDTYAYRTKINDLNIFEVDLPETQAWKRAHLQQANIAEPKNLKFVSTNFENNSLENALLSAGFDKTQPAFFSWLGVVVYLDEAAIERTLQFVASCAKSSRIIFDYSLPAELLNPMDQVALKLLEERVAKFGEPWKTFFDPQALVEKLKILGFGEQKSFSIDELNQRYLANRTDGMKLRGMTRLMMATV